MHLFKNIGNAKLAHYPAMAFAVCATGLARTNTTPLLTIEETDKALQKSVAYTGPGK